MKRKLLLIILVISLLSSGVFLSQTSAMADDGTPDITKNPTSEAIAIGGKTWFIAHADNATSLTWEMIDPNGYVHSLAEAMTMNPGLNLQALEGDTLAVSNVPQSVNGWGVQATFTGPGGTVSTSPAYIYVGDFLTAYISVIERYRYAVNLPEWKSQTAAELELSECINYSEKVGYALKDLDKNGIPELIIAGINYHYTEGPLVYDLYTLDNYQPVRLCVTWARSRNYLLRDNRIMNEGSNGAASSGFILKKVNGAKLEFLEGYWSSNSTDMSGQTMYHTTVEDNGYFDIYDYTMPSQQGFAIGEELRKTAWMPQLTAVS